MGHTKKYLDKMFQCNNVNTINIHIHRKVSVDHQFQWFWQNIQKKVQIQLSNWIATRPNPIEGTNVVLNPLKRKNLSLWHNQILKLYCSLNCIIKLALFKDLIL